MTRMTPRARKPEPAAAAARVRAAAVAAYLIDGSIACDTPRCEGMHRGGGWRSAVDAGWRTDPTGLRRCPPCLAAGWPPTANLAGGFTEPAELLEAHRNGDGSGLRAWLDETFEPLPQPVVVDKAPDPAPDPAPAEDAPAGAITLPPDAVTDVTDERPAPEAVRISSTVAIITPPPGDEPPFGHLSEADERRIAVVFGDDGDTPQAPGPAAGPPDAAGPGSGEDEPAADEAGQ